MKKIINGRLYDTDTAGAMAIQHQEPVKSSPIQRKKPKSGRWSIWVQMPIWKYLE